MVKGAKSGGYAKQKDVFDLSQVLDAVPSEEKQNRFALCGDLLTERRKRKAKSDAAEEPPKKASTVQTAMHPEPVLESDSDRDDYDLESMEDATKYMLVHSRSFLGQWSHTS